jgi:hypothetical protein
MALPSFTYSGVSYAGKPAGTTSFPLTTSGGKAIPYLLRTHIHVYSTIDNGVAKTELNRPAEWDFDTTGTAVILKTGIAGGTSIILRRITPDDALYVMFGQGTLLTAEQLNDAELFDLYLIQELYDRLMVQLATPSSSFAYWNNQGRSKDPAKGTPQEIAQTIEKLDQLLGDWPKDGKDKFIATTDAISARLDPYVQDAVPPALGLPQKEQQGKTWFDTDDLVQRFWDADAGAWVTLANTGPQGPPGPNVYYGTAFPPEPTSYGLWYDTNRKELRLRYNDGTGVQWVLAGGVAPPTGQLVAGNGVAANSVHEIQTLDQGVI